VEERQVKLGAESSDRVEILAGLAENDRVIIGNRGEFHAGEKVRPKPINENAGETGGGL